MPTSVKSALWILGFFALNSAIFQLLLMPEGKSPMLLAGLMLWIYIYYAIGIGLKQRRKVAFWSLLVISVLQTLPLIRSWFVPVSKVFGHEMPVWYAYSLYASAALGIACSVVLTLKPSRQFIFESRSEK